ncbi:Putative GroES-like superfamily, polyketide synthase, enoylreductase domain-containing protein [Septoria linicola]|uniref:GroES-like superfamily, polyketide synthase, enoylreductase domain-containing protein n=1 Tax=Septoria linicola TaxID=215465 RepID=A0A9Q9EH20_9PEZI|nr:Putative GroES-like superfamily, polyketide synthase, enoylreductase domain-containing protein [Septoria linicola]
MSTPETSRTWQFSSTKGGLEKNLKLNQTPIPQRKPNQHLVQVLAVGLNPVDYKPPEVPFFTAFALKTPATPALDFAGRIVMPADGSSLKPGQLVFGNAGPGGIMGGALGEYAIAWSKSVAVLPDGISPVFAASAPICGITAYQSIIPYVNSGSSVFINGGSGGTGVFGIQVAKAAGAYVTTTCSTTNVELCKSLGADEVIDYRKSNVLQSLTASGRKYDHIVDNVGSSPELYWKAHTYSTKCATFVTVGAQISLAGIWNTIAMRVWPGFLGGGQRKISMLLADVNTKDLSQLGQWMREGQIKPVIDSQFAFEDAPKAYEKLKTGRAKGKIVVKVSDDA